MRGKCHCVCDFFGFAHIERGERAARPSGGSGRPEPPEGRAARSPRSMWAKPKKSQTQWHFPLTVLPSKGNTAICTQLCHFKMHSAFSTKSIDREAARATENAPGGHKPPGASTIRRQQPPTPPPEAPSIPGLEQTAGPGGHNEKTVSTNRRSQASSFTRYPSEEQSL